MKYRVNQSFIIHIVKQNHLSFKPSWKKERNQSLFSLFTRTHLHTFENKNKRQKYPHKVSSTHCMTPKCTPFIPILKHYPYVTKGQNMVNKMEKNCGHGNNLHLNIFQGHCVTCLDHWPFLCSVNSWSQNTAMVVSLTQTRQINAFSAELFVQTSTEVGKCQI